MAVDIDSILQTEQARGIANMGNQAVQQLDFQAKVFTRLEASIDLTEAAAAKELTKAGMSVDLASIRPPALPGTP